MKSELKGVLLFLIGGAVGAGTCYIAMKEYFQRMADEQIEEVRTAFKQRLTEIELEKKQALGVAEEAIKSNDIYKNGKIGDNEATRSAFKGVGVMDGIIKESSKEYVDYTLYSKGKETVTKMDTEDTKKVLLEDVGPGSNEDEWVDEEDLPVDLGDGRVEMPNGDIIHTKDFVKQENNDIFEIDGIEYGNLRGYSINELLFYQMDKVLVDENDDILDNPDQLVGTVLEDSGFADDGRTTIWIRNERMGADLQIEKIKGPYSGMTEVADSFM